MDFVSCLEDELKHECPTYTCIAVNKMYDCCHGLVII